MHTTVARQRESTVAQDSGPGERRRKTRRTQEEEGEEEKTH